MLEGWQNSSVTSAQTPGCTSILRTPSYACVEPARIGSTGGLGVFNARDRNQTPKLFDLAIIRTIQGGSGPHPRIDGGRESMMRGRRSITPNVEMGTPILKNRLDTARTSDPRMACSGIARSVSVTGGERVGGYPRSLMTHHLLLIGIRRIVRRIMSTPKRTLTGRRTVGGGARSVFDISKRNISMVFRRRGLMPLLSCSTTNVPSKVAGFLLMMRPPMSIMIMRPMR